jgi:hypothetical protein
MKESLKLNKLHFTTYKLTTRIKEKKKIANEINMYILMQYYCYYVYKLATSIKEKENKKIDSEMKEIWIILISISQTLPFSCDVNKIKNLN